MKKELYICSYGIVAEQITSESLKAIKKSDLAISPCFDEKTSRFLGIKAKSVRNLSQRNQTMWHKQIILIKNLFKNHNVISYITYGNPCFLNSITYELRKELKNVKVTVYPAVSSFDIIINMFNELNLLPDDLILRFIDCKKKLDNFCPEKPMILFGGEYLIDKPETISYFVKNFKKNYPSSHKFFIIILKNFVYKNSRIISTAINEFERKLGYIKDMATIYIPPVKK
jgi:hypothetical protein